jgi:PAS domain S-box-containing protein
MKGDMERETRSLKQELKDDANLRRLAVVVRDSNDAIMIKDFSGRILAWNRGAVRMYGYTEQEALGLNILDLVPEESREEYRGMLAGLAKGEPVTSFETRRLTKDGRVLDVWLIVTTLPDEAGLSGTFSTTERDITERRRKEQDLIIANQELAFQHREKEKRAGELVIANQKLAFQNREKEKRADELIIANKELAFQSREKEKRADELIIANKELAFQSREKEKRADELIIANKELVYQNEEKEKRAAELIIANKELAFQNEEKEKRADELKRSNEELAATVEALRASEALLPAAINILPVGLWIIDAEGKIVTSSAAAQRIWAGVRYVGIDQLGEYKGWRTDSGKPIEAHEWAGARALEKGETTTEQEVEIECFDGTHKIILDSAVPLRKSDGSIGGAVTINQDITERRRAEEALHLANAYNRSLIEASLDPLVTIGRDGKITDVNAATEKVTGYSRQDLVGNDFLDYFLEPEKARAGYQRVFKEGCVVDYPLEIRHKDGRITSVLYNASVYRDEKGEVSGVFAAARDITERKRAEEAQALNSQLTQALLQLNKMTEATLQEITDFTLEESVRLTLSKIGYLAFLNQDESVLTMHSWSKTAMAECAIIEKPIIYPVATTGLWGEAVRQRRPVITNDYAADNPLKKTYPKGHVLVKRHMNIPVFAGSRIVLVAGVGNKTEEYDQDNVRQLTLLMEGMWRLIERKRAEEALRKAVGDLKRSNEELQQFAYVASHDLQEPLRAVASFTQLLSQRYKGRLDADADEFIAFAVGGANRMQTLINDLLSYSRLETRGKPPEPTDSHDALGQALANLGTAIQESGALVTNDDLPMVKADESQLAQLFQNLVGNAVKFHGKEPPRVHISAVSQGNEWLFSVRDNGIGIAQEYQERIFTIFQRLHSREEYPGTGIGLALCKRIVERHGGTIRVESGPGSGSTFFFTLPKP